MSRSLHDERGIISSFLIKVVLGVTIAGTVLLESGAILFTRLQVQDVAESAATAGAAALGTSRNCATAGEAATIQAGDKDPNAKVKSFECNPQNTTFTVAMTKRADTLIIHNIGFLKDWSTAETTVTAEPPHPDV